MAADRLSEALVYLHQIISFQAVMDCLKVASNEKVRLRERSKYCCDNSLVCEDRQAFRVVWQQWNIAMVYCDITDAVGAARNDIQGYHPGVFE
jgi:hypothetical protein